MTTWHSALYHGWVRHRRFVARDHEFRYPLFLVYLDLDEIAEVLDNRWLWSQECWNWASFWRRDFLGPANVPVADVVRQLVHDRTGDRMVGPIRVLTHLRYLGYSFNPVRIYYCFDSEGKRVEKIVLEVTNTPWGEKHCYVVDTKDQHGASLRGETSKVFHVSPFLGMELQYDFFFLTPSRRLVVHMNCRNGNERHLDATLSLTRREITTSSLTRTLLEYPWMTAQVIAGIHWQAFQLWRKKVPYCPHPNQS